MSDNQQGEGMDDFTRKYLYFLASIALIGLIWWLSHLDFRAREINALLDADADLSSYPYSFRVLSIDEGIAKISSPRSAEFSAIQSLRVMFPELQNSSAVSDEMMAAQKELARLQSSAGKLVKSQEGVDSIRWVLDKQWLTEKGMHVF